MDQTRQVTLEDGSTWEVSSPTDISDFQAYQYAKSMQAQAGATPQPQKPILGPVQGPVLPQPQKVVLQMRDAVQHAEAVFGRGSKQATLARQALTRAQAAARGIKPAPSAPYGQSLLMGQPIPVGKPSADVPLPKYTQQQQRNPGIVEAPYQAQGWDRLPFTEEAFRTAQDIGSGSVPLKNDPTGKAAIRRDAAIKMVSDVLGWDAGHVSPRSPIEQQTIAEIPRGVVPTHPKRAKDVLPHAGQIGGLSNILSEEYQKATGLSHEDASLAHGVLNLIGGLGDFLISGGAIPAGQLTQSVVDNPQGIEAGLIDTAGGLMQSVNPLEKDIPVGERATRGINLFFSLLGAKYTASKLKATEAIKANPIESAHSVVDAWHVVKRTGDPQAGKAFLRVAPEVAKAVNAMPEGPAKKQAQQSLTEAVKDAQKVSKAAPRPAQPKPAQAAPKPQHPPTQAGQPTPQAEVAAKPRPRREEYDVNTLSRMSGDDIYDAADRMRQTERDIENAIFGDQADTYRSAIRRENSMDDRISRQASDERDAMEAALSEADRNELFATLHKGLLEDDLRDIAGKGQEIDTARNATELGWAVSHALKVAKAAGDQPLDGLTEFTILRATERAKQLGINPQDVLDAAIVRRVAFDGNDAPELLGMKPEEVQQAVKRFAEKRNAPPKDEPKSLAAREPDDSMLLVDPQGYKYRVKDYDPKEIGVKPGLQYKTVTDRLTGTTDEFKGVKVYDPVTAGSLTVWEDLTGKPWVVNGHHRLEIANRTGYKGRVRAQVLSEADGVTIQEARAIGALQNIKENKGSATDAAAAMREMGLSAQDFRNYGVSLQSNVARHGVALTKLSDDAFQFVADGNVNEAVAAGIADANLSPAHQLAAMKFAAKEGLETRTQGAFLAEKARNQTLVEKADQNDLFGEISQELALGEQARIAGNVISKLGQDQRLSAMMLKGRAVGQTKVDAHAQTMEAGLQEMAQRVIATDPEVSRILEQEAQAYALDRTPARLRQAVERVADAARTAAGQKLEQLGVNRGSEKPSTPPSVQEGAARAKPETAKTVRTEPYEPPTGANLLEVPRDVTPEAEFALEMQAIPPAAKPAAPTPKQGDLGGDIGNKEGQLGFDPDIVREGRQIPQGSRTIRRGDRPEPGAIFDNDPSDAPGWNRPGFHKPESDSSHRLPMGGTWIVAKQNGVGADVLLDQGWIPLTRLAPSFAEAGQAKYRAQNVLWVINQRYADSVKRLGLEVERRASDLYNRFARDPQHFALNERGHPNYETFERATQGRREKFRYPNVSQKDRETYIPPDEAPGEGQGRLFEGNRKPYNAEGSGELEPKQIMSGLSPAAALKQADNLDTDLPGGGMFRAERGENPKTNRDINLADRLRSPLGIYDGEGNVIQTGSWDRTGEIIRANGRVINRGTEAAKSVRATQRAITQKTLEGERVIDLIERSLKEIAKQTKQKRSNVESYFIDLLERPLNDPSRRQMKASKTPEGEALRLHDELTESMRDYIIDARKALGKDTPPNWGVTDRGYYRHLFMGDIVLWIDGKPVAPDGTMITARTYAEAQVKAVQYAKSHPGAKIVARGRDNFRGDPTVRISTRRYFKTVSNIADTVDVPMSEIMEDLQGVIGRNAGKQKFFGSLLHRKGTKGYSKAYLDVMRMHVAQVYRTQELSKLNRALQPIIEDVAEQKPGLAQAMRERLEMLWGTPTKAEREFGALIEQIPGLRNYVASPAMAGRQLAHRMTALQALLKLRLSPRSAIVNLLQPYSTLWPYVKTVDFVGYQARLLKPETWKQLEVAGVLPSSTKLENSPQLLHRTHYANPLNWFEGASRINRAMGYLHGHTAAKKRGLSDTAAHAEGLSWAEKVEFDNSHYNVAPIFKGPLSRVLLQFKGFTIKNLEHIDNAMRRREGESQIVRAGRVGKLVGSQLAVGGVKSVKPVAYALGGYKLVQGISNMLQEQGMGKDEADMIANAIYYGAPSLIGQDLSASVNLFDVGYGKTPQEQLANFAFGPTVGTATGIYQKWGHPMAVAKSITPLARQAEQGYNIATKGINNQELKVSRAEDPKAENEPIELTPFEAVMRTLGFNPVKQSIYYDRKEAMKGDKYAQLRHHIASENPNWPKARVESATVRAWEKRERERIKRERKSNRPRELMGVGP